MNKSRKQRLDEARQVVVRSKAEQSARRAGAIVPTAVMEVQELALKDCLHDVSVAPSRLPKEYDLPEWTRRQAQRALSSIRRFTGAYDECDNEPAADLQHNEYTFEVRDGDTVLARFGQYVDAKRYMAQATAGAELLMVNNRTKAATLVYKGEA